MLVSESNQFTIPQPIFYTFFRILRRISCDNHTGISRRIILPKIVSPPTGGFKAVCADGRATEAINPSDSVEATRTAAVAHTRTALRCY